MDSFTAKPFTPGKPSTFRGFQGRKTPEMNRSSKTLPAGMPSLSGDILKQQIASMHNKTSPQTGTISSQGNFKHGESLKNTNPSVFPVVTSNDIEKRRNSMHKAPPPPTPDSIKNKTTDKTPEFLRKKLKPTGNTLKNSETVNKDSAENDNANKDNGEKDERASFRNSKLKFEQFSLPPKVAPKPRASSVRSVGPVKEVENLDEVEKLQQEEEHPATSVAESSLDDNNGSKSNEAVVNIEDEDVAKELCSNEVSEETEEVIEQTHWPKPENIILPDIPELLPQWAKLFVIGNSSLVVLDGDQKMDTPPSVLRNLKKSVGIIDKIVEDEEIYDDVDNMESDNADVVDGPEKGDVGDCADEIYDDVTCGQAREKVADSVEIEAVTEELYDDVTTVIEDKEELYDDVTANTQPIVEELYDDVTANAPSAGEELYDDVTGNTQQTEETYDDVEAALQNNLPSNEFESQEVEDIYEPVETIAQYVTRSNDAGNVVTTSNDSISSDDKINKKKEDKERKEKEKIEKKRKEEAERKMKKDEEEKKKRDKEERKKVEKERKSFNLKPDEDPVPIERHMTVNECKGKGKDLSFSRGEYLEIITKNNCPKGKWIAQNNTGKLGYVLTKDLGVDKRKSMFESSSPMAPGVAFGDEFYEDVTNHTTIEPSIMSLASSSSSNSPTSVRRPLSHFTKSAQPSAAKNQSEDVADEGGKDEDIYELVS